MKQVRTISGALRKARPLIEDGTTYFICYALWIACVDGRINRDTAFRAKSVIEERLAPHFSVGDWLAAKKLTKGMRRNSEYYDEQLRLYRLRWIDALIQEFETKGD